MSNDLWRNECLKPAQLACRLEQYNVRNGARSYTTWNSTSNCTEPHTQGRFLHVSFGPIDSLIPKFANYAVTTVIEQ